jgi:hypothetical protein
MDMDKADIFLDKHLQQIVNTAKDITLLVFDKAKVFGSTDEELHSSVMLILAFSYAITITAQFNIISTEITLDDFTKHCKNAIDIALKTIMLHNKH